MSKTMAIFGAGPGFGLSVARRFGREGYDLALVARNRDRLDQLVHTLDADGVEATAFTADLTDRKSAADALAGIESTLGPVDVLHYSAMGVLDQLAPPLDIDPDNLSSQLEQNLFTPLTLTRQVLPGMLERGDGGILFSYGMSAVVPVPDLGNIGLSMNSLSYYARLLNQVLGPRGVFAGGLAIAAFIEDTPQAAMAESLGLDHVAVVSADDLADAFWTLFEQRTQAQIVAPEPATAKV